MHDIPLPPQSPEPADSDDLPRELVEDITRRLRAVCAHLPPDDMADLVAEIARVKIRSARRAASLPGLSGIWDPPASEVFKMAELAASPPSLPSEPSEP